MYDSRAHPSTWLQRCDKTFDQQQIAFLQKIVFIEDDILTQGECLISSFFLSPKLQ